MMFNLVAAWPLGLALVALTHPAAASHLARGRHFVRAAHPGPAPVPAPAPAPVPAPAPAPGMINNDGTWSDHAYFMPLALGGVADWDPATVDHEGSVRYEEYGYLAPLLEAHLDEKFDKVLFPPPKAEDYKDKDGKKKKQKREVTKEPEEKVPMHRIGKLVGRPLGPHLADDNDDDDKKTTEKKNDKRSTDETGNLLHQTDGQVLVDSHNNPVSSTTGILTNDEPHTKRKVQPDRQLSIIPRIRVGKVKKARQCTSATDEHACDRFFLLEMLLDNDRHERLKMGLAAAREQKLKANKTRIHDIKTQTGECSTKGGDKQTCYTTSFLIEYLAAVDKGVSTTTDNKNQCNTDTLAKRLSDESKHIWNDKFDAFMAMCDWVGDALLIPGQSDPTTDCVG